MEAMQRMNTLLKNLRDWFQRSTVNVVSEGVTSVSKIQMI